MPTLRYRFLWLLVGLGLCIAGQTGTASAASAIEAIPKPVSIARTTKIPGCTLHVDAAAGPGGTGSAARPLQTISAAVARAANSGSVICVAEGVYPESIAPGAKAFVLAGGFESGTSFKVRDSAAFVSKAQGAGGSFLRIVDPGPSGAQRTVVDGFEITGYAQAIVRDIWYSQKFDITNNHIHDNDCGDTALAGAAFALINVSGSISRNVIQRNTCGRGGGGVINDSLNENRVSIVGNLIAENQGTEPQTSHGGGLYLFVNRVEVKANAFVGNRVTGWGAGLYLGAFPQGGQTTTARLSFNVYRGNRAGIAGGGLFCDDSATCRSVNELFDRNCGGNVYLDSGASGVKPTIALFDQMTNVLARGVNCTGPGEGVRIDKGSTSADTYTIRNAVFFGNAKGQDIAASCDVGCNAGGVTVTYSMVQKPTRGGFKVTYGAGILPPADPGFVSQATGDFHLKSRFGHFTPSGYVSDPVSSPLLAKGDPASPTARNPKRAGNRTELGAYGNSAEASYVR